MTKQKTLLVARKILAELGINGEAIRARAYLLVEAGFTTAQSLRDATDEELEAVQGIGPAAVAQLRELLEG